MSVGRDRLLITIQLLALLTLCTFLKTNILQLMLLYVIYCFSSTDTNQFSSGQRPQITVAAVAAVPSQSEGDLNLKPNLFFSFLSDFGWLIRQTHTHKCTHLPLPATATHTRVCTHKHLLPARSFWWKLICSLRSAFFPPHGFLTAVSALHFFRHRFFSAMFQPWNKWRRRALSGEGRYRRYCYSRPLRCSVQGTFFLCSFMIPSRHLSESLVPAHISHHFSTTHDDWLLSDWRLNMTSEAFILFLLPLPQLPM